MTGIAGCHYARFIQLGMLSDLDEALYFAPRDILITPFRWVTSPSASMPASPSAERSLTSTKHFPSNAMH